MKKSSLNFIFCLKDKSGKTYYGILPARDKRDVRRRLAHMGLFFVDAQACDIEKVYQSRMNLDVLLMVTHRLSSLIESGVPILNAMSILWRQTQDKTSQIVINHMYRDLEDGRKLSEAMDRFPNIFSTTYRALICVAEGSGGLVAILRKITDFLQYQRKIIMQTKRATLYPLIVLVSAVLVLIGMFTFVVPVFQNVLMKMNAELPLLTKVVLGISAVIRSPYFFVPLLVLVILFILLYQKFRGNKKFIYHVDRCKLRIPLLGNILRMLAVSQFIHSMSMLISAGRTITESFNISKESANNQEIAQSAQKVQKQVEQGSSLYDAFKAEETFPILLVEMVGIGESSGKLAIVFEQLSAHFDEEVEFDLNRLFTVLEPLLIVMVGAIVIVTLLAIYLPIFSIWRSLATA